MSKAQMLAGEHKHTLSYVTLKRMFLAAKELGTCRLYGRCASNEIRTGKDKKIHNIKGGWAQISDDGRIIELLLEDFSFFWLNHRIKPDYNKVAMLNHSK